MACRIRSTNGPGDPASDFFFRRSLFPSQVPESLNIGCSADYSHCTAAPQLPYSIAPALLPTGCSRIRPVDDAGLTRRVLPCLVLTTKSM